MALIIVNRPQLFSTRLRGECKFHRIKTYGDPRFSIAIRSFSTRYYFARLDNANFSPYIKHLPAFLFPPAPQTFQWMSDHLCYNGIVKKHNEVPAAYPLAFSLLHEKTPHFVPKPFFHVKKHAVFTKLRTVLDGFGHLWTVLDKILCYNGTVKKGKSVGGSSAGAFSLPKSERKWVPCDSPSSAHKRHSPFSPNGPTVWYPVSNQRRLILFSFPHCIRRSKSAA